MRKLLAYAFALMILVTPITANSHEETGLAVVEQSVVVVQQVEPSYRERLEQMSSRGEIRTINMKITAYDLSYESCGKSPDHPAYGITSTGKKVKDGYVAVDPEVIPYGTRMYIDGYGVVQAEDTGGDINGNRLDIYMSSKDDCIKWGIQDRKVYIIGR